MALGGPIMVEQTLILPITLGALALENSIVALNASNGGADVQGVPTSLVAYNNLVGVDGTGSLTAANHNLLNVSDPGLGPLANALGVRWVLGVGSLLGALFALLSAFRLLLCW